MKSLHYVGCRDEFYQLFYSIFDDQYAAMDSILNGKELFAFQVSRMHEWCILSEISFIVISLA